MLDERDNLGEGPVGVVRRRPAVSVRVIMAVLVRSARVLVDREFCRRHRGAEHAVGVDVGVAERKRPQRLFEIGQRQAGVEERPERHVAGDPGEAVKIQDPTHSSRDSLKL